MLDRIIIQTAAIDIFIEMIALRIAVAANTFFAFPEIGLVPYLPSVNISAVCSPFMLKCCGDHALHDVQVISVSQFHRSKISCVQLNGAILRICIRGKRAVIQVLDSNRHPIAAPYKIFGFKHQIAALQIDAAAPESAKVMRMCPVRGIDAVGGLIDNADDRTIST